MLLLKEEVKKTKKKPPEQDDKLKLLDKSLDQEVQKQFHSLLDAHLHLFSILELLN
jgi:hypothetical protein